MILIYQIFYIYNIYKKLEFYSLTIILLIIFNINLFFSEIYKYNKQN
jgi:hypothetical protein